MYRWINGNDPRQYGLDFGLWTRSVVADLIARKFGIHLGLTAGRHSPSVNQCRTVFRAQPSSAAIRFEPHPNAFSRSIAETSSGAFILSFRWSSSVEGTVSPTVIPNLLQAVKGVSSSCRLGLSLPWRAIRRSASACRRVSGQSNGNMMNAGIALASARTRYVGP